MPTNLRGMRRVGKKTMLRTSDAPQNQSAKSAERSQVTGV
jgi:hypothetical protein